MPDRLNTATEHFAVKARGIPCYAQGDWDLANDDRGPMVYCCSLYDRKGYRAKWIESRMTRYDWRDIQDQIDEQMFDEY